MGSGLSQARPAWEGKSAIYQRCFTGKNPLRGGADSPRHNPNNLSAKDEIGKVVWGVCVKNRAYFLMLAATTLLSAPAMAAPVFMLQFGSFETRAEAETRLAALKGEHGGVIGDMQSGIREVTLPPDNLVVYRTQAGPVETRASAQSICSQLASNGDECYVVETAMAPSFAPATTQVAQATPPASVPTTAPTAPAPLNNTDINPRATSAIGTSASSPKLATTTTETPAPAPGAMSTAALMQSGSTVSPQAEPPVQMAPLPMRDPQNAEAISRVTAAPVTNTAPSATPVVVADNTTNNSPAMQQAMDRAAKEQNEHLTDREKQIAAAPTPPDAKKEGSFWSRINPFSGDEEQVVVAPKPVAPAPVTAPVETVETTPMPAPPNMPSPVMAPEPLSPLPQNTPAPAPIVMATAAPVPAMPMLPPPPAPLVGKGAINPNQSTSASLRAPAPVIVPESTGTINGQAPIVIADAPFQPANGNVRVGEAQRVPLSQAAVAPLPAPPAPVVLAPGAPSVALHPNATLGQKTLWAHVGQFVDAQAALAFWENYRQTHPDFPVVRVRVTSPLQSLNRGNEQVSLRVGPFAKESSIGNLCKTISDQQRQNDTPRLMCGPITDLGIASQVGGARNGYLPGSRYNR